MTNELSQRYERDVRRWCAVPKKGAANSAFESIQAAYLVLRNTEDGRTAIERLMDDTDRCVVGLASTHALAWDPDAARRRLVEIRDSGEDWASFDAGVTINEFDAGKLNLDWGAAPKRG